MSHNSQPAAEQGTESTAVQPRLWRTVARSCRLRCPHCGQGPLAKSWRQTYDNCSHCRFDFRVEGGFYLGSIYFNYGLMAVVTLSVAMPLVWYGYTTPLAASATGVVLCVVLAMWFWRYARSLWLGFGYYIDHNVRAGTRPPAANAGRRGDQPEHLASGEDSFESTCSFCHKSFRVIASKKRTWDACMSCGQTILLVPARRTLADGSVSEQQRSLIAKSD